MKIERFYEFVAVAETLNFRRAAKTLFITQPTLSTHIRELEAELGCQLFERDTHVVALTLAGKAILEKTRTLIAEYEAVLATAGTFGERSAMKTVRIAAPLRFQSTSRRVTRLIETLKGDGAGFGVRAIDLGMQDTPEMLEQDRCDVVLSHYAAEYDLGRLHCVKLYTRWADVWVGAHSPLAHQASVELAELADMVYRPPVNSPDNPLTQGVFEVLRERGLEPTVGTPLDDQGNLDERDFFLVFSGEEPSGTFGVGARRLSLREQIPMSVAVTCRREQMGDPAIMAVIKTLVAMGAEGETSQDASA